MIRGAEQSLQRTVADYLSLCVPAPPEGPWWTAVNPVPAKSRAAAGVSKAMGLRAGTPDFAMCWKGRMVGVELKAGRGRMCPAQLETHAAIPHHGRPAREARASRELRIQRPYPRTPRGCQSTLCS